MGVFQINHSKTWRVVIFWKNDRLWLDFLDKNSLEILESRKKEQRPYEIYESSKSYSQMTFGCPITSIWCIVFSFHVQPFSVSVSQDP